MNLSPLHDSHQLQTTESHRMKPIVGTSQVESSSQCKLKVSSKPQVFIVHWKSRFVNPAFCC